MEEGAMAKTVGLDRAHSLCYTRDMTIKRLDHVSVVVDDLAAAIAFFTALGMTLEGEMSVEGPWVDRVNGLESVQVDIVMMRTPDGHGRLELTKFRNPKLVEIEPAVYSYIAIGGIVPLKDHELGPVVEACDEVRHSKTIFHLLGVSRPHSVNLFRTFGVASFDSTSPLRQAFKDDTDNYYTLDRNYIAVRVPQVDGNTKLRRRIGSGELHAARLRHMEKHCLEMLTAFDRGEASLQD